MAEEPKKLSDLEQIENISGDDLLLVSDYDAGACVSKKMTMAQAVEYICAAVAQDPAVAETIRQAVDAAVTSGFEQTVMQIVKGNIDEIVDAMDHVEDGTITIDGNNE